MTTRLLLLCGLLALGAAAPVITSQNSLRPEAPLQLTPCDYCQELVSTLEEFVADPQTQAAVSEFVQESLCTGLPGEIATICDQEVPVLVASAAAAIQSALTPADVCAVMSICPGASAAELLGVKVQGTPFDCPVCKMVVVAFVQRLQDPARRAEIEGDMRAACDNLAPEAKARCLQDVTDLFRALDNLLHDVDPQGVCAVVDFCDSSPPGTAGASGAPSALRALRAAARQLATGDLAAASAPQARDGLTDMCGNCKAIVVEAAAILQDPKTQAELLEYAKEGCSVFQDFKDQCELYVTLYGPLVFNMLISYLQPDSLCTRIGYCPATPATLVVS